MGKFPDKFIHTFDRCVHIQGQQDVGGSLPSYNRLYAACRDEINSIE